MEGNTIVQFDLKRADRLLEGRCEIARKNRRDPFARPYRLDGEIRHVGDELTQFAPRLFPNAVRFRVEFGRESSLLWLLKPRYCRPLSSCRLVVSRTAVRHPMNRIAKTRSVGALRTNFAVHSRSHQPRGRFPEDPISVLSELIHAIRKRGNPAPLGLLRVSEFAPTLTLYVSTPDTPNSTAVLT